ncbi:MAG: lamin tail domain-containing protein [Ignavibacteria bacterium]|nr:lamin tail domain-containing protein [Ignavibacteria bacterium]
MRRAIFFILLIMSWKVFGQVVINEVMYSPTTGNKEWFEIYNVGTTAVNLQNWKWRDAAASNPIRTITTQSVILNAGAYAIVCEDSNNLRTVYPNVTGIILQSIGWNALNNTGNENVVLYKADMTTSDSLTYNNTWGGGSGISLERKDASAPTNQQNNWGSCIRPIGATPNQENSITQKSYDLALVRFIITPSSPLAGQDVSMEFLIKNIGKNQASGFQLNVYKDVNFDSIPQPSELINSQVFGNLNQNDSVAYNFFYKITDTSVQQFIGKVIFAPDQDTTNNTLIRRVYVGERLVINEIMYDPLTISCEWVEIYNPTNKEINLIGWKFTEESSTTNLGDSVFNKLKPGCFIVIAKDTTIYNRFDKLRNISPDNRLLFKSSLSLNNEGELVKILDASGNVVEGFVYNPKWHNPNLSDKKGYSLERINPLLKGDDNKNWSSCANPLGGTPAEKNSIYTPIPISTAEITISPNPFSPDGDGFEDFTVIKYKLKSNITQLRMKVFDVNGRLVRTLLNNQLSGSEGEIIFNGLNDNGERLRLGIYIIFLEAVDSQGGVVETVKATVVVATKL